VEVFVELFCYPAQFEITCYGSSRTLNTVESYSSFISDNFFFVFCRKNVVEHTIIVTIISSVTGKLVITKMQKYHFLAAKRAVLLLVILHPCTVTLIPLINA